MYMKDLEQARLDFQTYLDRAFAEYFAGVREVGVYGVADVEAEAMFIHNAVLRARNNEPSGPAAVIGNARRLVTYGPEGRYAIHVAYRKIYGRELATDLRTYADRTFPSNEQYLTNDALYKGVVVPIPNPVGQSTLDVFARWVGSAASNVVTWVGNLSWQNFTDAAQSVAGTVGSSLEQAWSSTVQFATNTYEMMRDDPIGFIETANEVFVNSGAIVANTFTFGLIPSLDQHATNLMNENNFYRVVNIAAIVGREVAIGVATGGAGAVVGAGVRVAGATAVRFAVRKDFKGWPQPLHLAERGWHAWQHNCSA